jgi:hypothetical protein
MMVRKSVGILPFLVVLILVQPLSGQIGAGHMWDGGRPDAAGPASVTDHRILDNGQMEFALRYLNLKRNSVGWGTDSLTVDQVWALGYEQAPARMYTQGFAFDFLYGVRDNLTVALSGTFAQKSMEHWAQSTDSPGSYQFFETENMGLMDVRLTAIYNVFQSQAARAYLHGGLSIPLGSVDSEAKTVDPNDINGDPVNVVLPYHQQLGSGTFDLHPGFTVDFQNGMSSLGMQAKAVIRIGQNSRDWALGNTFEGYTWAGFKITDWVGATAGLKYSTWSDIDGMESDVDMTSAIFQSPAYSVYQAGWRVEIPLGVNLIMPAGSPLEGDRFGFELFVPIHQDLDQPQVRQDVSFVLSWKKAF